MEGLLLMPVRIPNKLPATKTLAAENIFIMNEERAESQDIRPLRFAILNLMPNKITTETQILRLISNSPLQIEIVLLHTKSYTAKNTTPEHLDNFYTNFEHIKEQRFDGLIITGAPVGRMDFEDVEYWEELTQIMEWSKHNVFSTLHTCWGAYAGLNYHYGVNKHLLDTKIFGVFEHTILQPLNKLLRGFDDTFWVPHSRYSALNSQEILNASPLEILAQSEQAGAYLIATPDFRQVFLTGHPEYDRLTLHEEYMRDISGGLNIAIPENYYPNNDPKATPIANWRSHANLLFTNWLNYCVYQETPFDLYQVEDYVL
jgi:homoserine O-succinyltransferase